MRLAGKEDIVDVAVGRIGNWEGEDGGEVLDEVDMMDVEPRVAFYVIRVNELG